ncbi:caspase family protein [Calditrichota bacterium]
MFLILPLLLIGCATFMHGTRQSINVNTNPSGAKVIVMGEYEGETPTRIRVGRTERRLVVRFEKEGYEPVEVELRRSVSGWVWGNILIWGVVGVAVDFASGSAYKISPSYVHANLQTIKTLNLTSDYPKGFATIEVTSEPEDPLVDKEIPIAKTKNRDAVAVVIGNTNYPADVPAVEFALQDAIVMNEYLVRALGYREGNIIFQNDAGLAFFRDVFGTAEEPRGQLANMIKQDKSDVFVYYSGHGAPDVNEQRGYLVPVDCHPNSVNRNGYPLDLLYDNLGKCGAKSITVVIDACFSGGSDKGMLIGQASPVGIKVNDPTMSWGINGALFTATSSGQIASWYAGKKHGLYTYFFLKGLQGSADVPPYGNGDGTITAGEMQAFLSDPTESVPYWARRLHNGREQSPEFRGNLAKVIK